MDTTFFYLVSILPLIIVIILIFSVWKLIKKNTKNTYIKAKTIFIIYIVILLLSMVTDEVFLKSERQSLANGNHQEATETINHIYSGNTENIKDKYMYDEWVFPYTDKELVINEYNSLKIMVERVKGMDEIKATMYYSQLINDYEMPNIDSLIELNMNGQELNIINKAEEKTYYQLIDSTILSSPLTETTDIWGESKTFTILYLQIPEDLMIETTSEMWIEYVGEIDRVIRE